MLKFKLVKEYILETDRLKLRKLTIEDATSFYNLNQDPRVIEHTGDQAFASIEEAQELIANYDQYAYQLGRWAVELKSDSSFIGWCGLKFNLGCGDIDLGFRFFQEHWNKGFATEAAYACLLYGFEKLSLFEIIGRSRKENMSSVKVLQKIGMAPFPDHDSNSDENIVFVSRKLQFERKQDSFVSIL